MPSPRTVSVVIVLFVVGLLLPCASSASSAGSCIRNIEDYGAVAGKEEAAIAVSNARAISSALAGASGCQVVVDAGKRYFVVGGIYAADLVQTTLMLEGEIYAAPLVDSWPLEKENWLPLVSGEDTGHAGQLHGRFADVVVFRNCSDLVISGGGRLDGGGVVWWNKEILPQLFGHLNASRPKLFRILESTDVLVENISLHNSPSWTLILQDVNRAEVSNIRITVDRKKMEDLKKEKAGKQQLQQQQQQVDSSYSTPLEPQDLNTDGVDCTGTDIYIHDSYIENDDDSIAVKPCSPSGCTFNKCTSNVRVERMVLTGFGASIGSVPPEAPEPNCVRDVVFRNISMPNTGKGIYIKSNPSCESKPNATAIIENILFEDVNITNPRWWSIFIGPQQQHEPGEAVSDKCALTYPLSNHCPTQGCVTFRNITLRRVDVYHPWLSAGVVLGNSTNPMQDIFFDRVVFHQQSRFPFGDQYKCENVQGKAEGCVPQPGCF